MSYQRQVIGNQGVVRPQPKAHTHAYAQPKAHTHAYAQPRSFAQQDADFWGTGIPYQGYPGLGGGQFPAQASPFAQEQGGGGLAALFGGGGAAPGASGSGGFNIAQIKNVIDRLGGVEAIVDTVSKVQRMIASIHQIAPMIKVLLGSLGKGKAAAAGFTDGVHHGPARKRRRKRKATAVVSAHRRKPRR